MLRNIAIHFTRFMWHRFLGFSQNVGLSYHVPNITIHIVNIFGHFRIMYTLLTQECHLMQPWHFSHKNVISPRPVTSPELIVSSDDEPEQNFVQLLQDNILDSAVGVCFSFFTPGAL